jgi:hypothetical protein
MSVEAILARLKDVRRNYDGWMALCPAHTDRNPSLSIHERQGRILVHCFANCTTEAVCDALRIRVKDLFREPGAACYAQPEMVHEAKKRIAGLRSRLSRQDRERAVTVVLADETNLDLAIGRALALAVEGELVQVALDGETK